MSIEDAGQEVLHLGVMPDGVAPVAVLTAVPLVRGGT